MLSKKKRCNLGLFETASVPLGSLYVMRNVLHRFVYAAVEAVITACICIPELVLFELLGFFQQRTQSVLAWCVFRQMHPVSQVGLDSLC